MTDAHLDARIRQWLWHRQGLDGALRGHDAASALAQGGWARSVGGAGPYLSLHARTGLGRAAIDAAAARLDIHELPSARGCTYVLPAADFALGLRAAQGHADEAQIAQARKSCGVTDAELDRLCEAVLGALADGPAEPEVLKARCGDAVRHLGEVGKKKGLTTTLPLALGRLQTRGALRRVPVGGRLDVQRYAYVRWAPSPFEEGAEGNAWADADEATVLRALAERFFRWGGPATVAQFAFFAGAGVRAARAATDALGLVPVAAGDDRLLLSADRAAFSAYTAPDTPQVSLVSSLDALTALRRDVRTHLSPAACDAPVLDDRALATLGALADLPHHAVVDRGELVGLWDFDPDAAEIVWAPVRPLEAELRDAVHAAVEATLPFVRDELGDARAFSLDGPKSRGPRLASLSAAAR